MSGCSAGAKAPKPPGVRCDQARGRSSAIYCGVAVYVAYVERDYDEAIRLSRERIYEGLRMAGVSEG